jgi:dolichol kinase
VHCSTKIVKDPVFVKSIGHEEGKEHMLLLGPVQYGVCATVLTALSFRAPLSVIPISVLCAGDSAAAIWGYYRGKNKLPWNRGKVWDCACIHSVCT